MPYEIEGPARRRSSAEILGELMCNLGPIGLIGFSILILLAGMGLGWLLQVLHGAGLTP